jgi:hypothetical protein
MNGLLRNGNVGNDYEIYMDISHFRAPVVLTAVEECV